MGATLTSPAAAHRAEAAKAIKQGRFDRAEQALSKVVEHEPRDAVALHDLGVALAKQGKLDQAIAIFGRALDVKPDAVETRRNLGVALAQRGRKADAAAAFQKAVELKPDSHHCRRDWAGALKTLGKFAEAAEQYRKAIRVLEAEGERGSEGGTERGSEQRSRIRENSGAPDATNLTSHEASYQFDNRNPKSKIQNPKSLAECYHELGLVLVELKQQKEAEESYRQALALKPEFPEALNNLGILLESSGKLAEAEECYRKALAIRPKAADVHNNLGVALAAQRKYEEAVASYRQALAITPDSPLALNNMGNSLRALGQIEEAVSSLRWAIRLKPDYAEAYNNLGIALVQLGQDDEAVRSYERALMFRPDYPEAHLNRSLAWLANGDFRRGWTEYEWRWMAKDVIRRTFNQRRWDGCDLFGRTIFIYLEQGLGDTLQFVRYARLLKQRGARVIVEAQKSLVRLLSGCPFIDQVVPHGSPLPAFDLQVPLLSLPAMFRTLPDTIPDEVPYLFPDPALVEKWRERLCRVGQDCGAIAGPPNDDHGGPALASSLGPPYNLRNEGTGNRAQETGQAADSRSGIRENSGTPDAAGLTSYEISYDGANPKSKIQNPKFLIAIAWQGNPQYRGDRQRSIPLRAFAPLAAVPGVQLISLQKGFGSEQVQQVAGQFPVVDLGPIDEEAGAFMDTAAIMKCVDLVITSDTAMPHLAGALGVPVWMALPQVADWRWMRAGQRSPWYPTMRIFRQGEGNGDGFILCAAPSGPFRQNVPVPFSRQESWDELFERMAEELRSWSVARSQLSLATQKRQTESTRHRPHPSPLPQGEGAIHEHTAGVALAKDGKLEEAEQRLARAVELDPDFAAAHHNLGVVRARRNRLSKAVASFRRTLEVDPEFSDAYGNLGLAYYEQGRFEEAVYQFRQALRRTPGSAEHLNNLAAALMQLARPAEAAECYRRALELRPDYVEAHHNLGRALLSLGEFEQGWLEYEWRERLPGARPRASDKPRWDGSPLAGRTLLVYAEQGLGDTLQFIRYARLAKQTGGKVIVECQPELVRLLDRRHHAPRDAHHAERDDYAVVARGAALPEHDVQAALMSLPTLLRTTLATMPSEVPYLSADAALVDKWGERFKCLESFKVGIAWQGNRNWVGDRYRSLPLAEFEPLADLPEVRLVNLQKGAGAEQLVAAGGHFQVVDFGPRLDTAAGAFMDTAAIMRHLDLVVTSDTSIAHLAGALGVPVWVVLPFAPDWRWLLDRCDSPWYPTMRLFRQSRSGDWAGVFRRIRKELARRLPVVRSPMPVARANPQMAGRLTVATDNGPLTTDKPENPKSVDLLHQAIAQNGIKQSNRQTNSINLTCPINQLGYGVVGLNVLKALVRLGREVACWPIGRIDAAADDRKLVEQAVERQKHFDGHAPSVRIAHQNHLAEHVGSPRIGFPIFELDRFTEQELNHLRNQDRLFVTCKWAKKIVEECGAAPAGAVDVVPLGVDRDAFHEAGENGQHRGRTTVFLSVGKWERRKGHDVLLEAFNKAFGPQDDVELWMLTFNPVIGNDRSATVAKNQQWETLYKSCPLAGRIRILPRLADQREVAATMRQADCGVFLSRGEGWNLPLLEMMSCGRQVIATNYSAHTEYCDPSNALLVEIEELEDAYDDRWFFGHGRWAKFGDRQMEQAIALMRQVHQRQQDGGSMLNSAGVETAKRFSWDATAARMVDLL